MLSAITLFSIPFFPEALPTLNMSRDKYLDTRGLILRGRFKKKIQC